MTTEEVYEKFGDLPMKFYNLDEYAFCFQNVLGNGMVLRAYVGGDMEKLYQTNISRQIPITLKECKHYYAFLRQYNDDIWSESYNTKYDQLQETLAENVILEQKIQMMEIHNEEMNKIWTNNKAENLMLSEKIEKMESELKSLRKKVAGKKSTDYQKGINECEEFLIESGFGDIADLVKQHFTS